MKKDALPISPQNYARIFLVLHSVLKSIDKSVKPSCLFYNTVGAFLLEHFFKIKAVPMMGGAFMMLDEYEPAGPLLLVFADVDGQESNVSGEKGNFHCWVETENHVLDFTAPVYQEYLESSGRENIVPRKMFQKKKSLMANSHHDVCSNGDYFFQRNSVMTMQYLLDPPQKKQIGDLVNICAQWFRPYPMEMEGSITISDNFGEITSIEKTNLKVLGVW